MSKNKTTIKKETLTCNRCFKKIEDLAYIKILPSIILQEFRPQVPPIFSCIEHQENYCKGMIFHDDCWMAELKDHKVEVHDMTELRKKYAREALEKLASDKGGG